MHFFTAIFAAIVIAAPALGGPAPIRTVEEYSQRITNKYIVMLKEGASLSSTMSRVSPSAVTHNWDKLNGFAGIRSSESEVLIIRGLPDVESVSKDGIAQTTTLVTQTNAPWGLASALNFTYVYEANAGEGTDIYILDTGVNTAHSEFGGRAEWGVMFGSYQDVDGNGHGTHCAGTAAGSRFGVAKEANIIAVKVLSDSGSGPWSDVISGLNFVMTRAQSSGRPSIALMSLSGPASTAVDTAVASLTSAGIHVVVAAGNNNINAANISPARAPSAITVGASTFDDVRAWFSNYGSVVNMFAPGQDIVSSWIGGTTAVQILDGTSMATPHVAGLIAYLISVHGQKTPVDMRNFLDSYSLENVLTDIPSGTVNKLAHNGVDATA